MKRASAIALVLALWPAGALASNGLESPEAGVVQVSRGGAWLARADDPLAAYFNPAAMVTQPHGVHLGAHLMIRSHCFERVDAAGQPVAPADGFLPPPEEVCAEIPPFPNPQLAGSFRLHERVALGVAVLGPHGHGATEWPATVEYENAFGFVQPHPSPARYLIVESEGILLFPTVSLGVAILEELSVGAGFIWGVGAIHFASMAEAVSPVRDQPDDFANDVRASIDGLDAFVPGFVVSALYSPHRRFDVAAWFKWMDSVRSDLDLRAEAKYYSNTGEVNEAAINDPANITELENVGELELPIPMEARLGFRYRHPRDDAGRPQEHFAKHGDWARDAMSQDLFDVELDLTWAHNSALDVVQVRMKPNIRINGTPGFVPENADVPHQWKEVFGVRLGGEVVPIPDFLAVRAGGFFESQGVDDAYLNLDFHQGWRAGIATGLTVRVSLVDISAAYQHTFFGALDNGGAGAVRGLSGDATTGDATPGDASDDFRTRQIVNGGRATSSLDEVALGATVRF